MTLPWVRLCDRLGRWLPWWLGGLWFDDIAFDWYFAHSPRLLASLESLANTLEEAKPEFWANVRKVSWEDLCEGDGDVRP